MHALIAAKGKPPQQHHMVEDWTVGAGLETFAWLCLALGGKFEAHPWGCTVLMRVPITQIEAPPTADNDIGNTQSMAGNVLPGAIVSSNTNTRRQMTAMHEGAMREGANDSFELLFKQAEILKELAKQWRPVSDKFVIEGDGTSIEVIRGVPNAMFRPVKENVSYLVSVEDHRCRRIFPPGTELLDADLCNSKDSVFQLFETFFSSNKTKVVLFLNEGNFEDCWKDKMRPVLEKLASVAGFLKETTGTADLIGTTPLEMYLKTQKVVSDICHTAGPFCNAVADLVQQAAEKQNVPFVHFTTIGRIDQLEWFLKENNDETVRHCAEYVYVYFRPHGQPNEVPKQVGDCYGPTHRAFQESNKLLHRLHYWIACLYSTIEMCVEQLIGNIEYVVSILILLYVCRKWGTMPELTEDFKTKIADFRSFFKSCMNGTTPMGLRKDPGQKSAPSDDPRSIGTKRRVR